MAERGTLQTELGNERGGNLGNQCPPVAPQGRSEAAPCHQGNIYCNVADSQAWIQALRELRDPLFDLAKKLPESQAALVVEIAAWVNKANALISEVETSNKAIFGTFLRNAEVQRLLAHYSQGCGLWQRARAADPSIEPLPTPFGTWRDAAKTAETTQAIFRYGGIALGVLVVGAVAAYVYRSVK